MLFYFFLHIYFPEELQMIIRPILLENFVNNYLDKKIKSIKNIITGISFNNKITNVSEQLINVILFILPLS